MDEGRVQQTCPTKIADDDLRAWQDAQVVVRTAGRAQPTADVIGEGQRVIEV